MKVNEYIKEDAVGLSNLVKQKEISPKELIELSEQRLNEVGNDLNAVASSRIEKAKLEAKQLTNYEGAFPGIPFYLKGISQSLKDEPLEGGAKLLKGVVAEETSYFSKMRLDAGLLCLVHSTRSEEHTSELQSRGHL